MISLEVVMIIVLILLILLIIKDKYKVEFHNNYLGIYFNYYVKNKEIKGNIVKKRWFIWKKI